MLAGSRGQMNEIGCRLGKTTSAGLLQDHGYLRGLAGFELGTDAVLVRLRSVGSVAFAFYCGGSLTLILARRR